ncbi:MAG TPA: methionyl-tRNA formyltransferase [Candidatus Bathyarchaeia archaeon]|nr:methionyl-tRNA formyltransferase [Candidatus Bathyarchaeia archaeon]
MTKKSAIFFFGQDWRSAIILAKILKSENCRITAVITLPEKSRTGEKKPLPNPVRRLADKYRLATFNLTDLSLAIMTSKYRGDIGILASFGAKIPQEIINLFPKGILVIHPSLLPKYRGTTPVQAAILAGDSETGVTIFKMDKLFDHGPILAQCKEKIRPDDTTPVLQKRLFSLGAEMLIALLSDYLRGKLKLRSQNHSQATCTIRLTRSAGKINWQRPDIEIERLTRAMSPWPGTWTEVKVKSQKTKIKEIKRLKILKAHLERNRLVLDQIQLEGKKPVGWAQFQKGYPEAKIIRTR